MFIMPITQ